jgi:DNA polymerase bacteriophage-type
MDEGIWLDDEFCQMVVNIYRKEKYPEVPALWKATQAAAIAAVVEGGVHFCGGDELGLGAVSYFMSADGNFLHCRLPSGRLLAYLYPRVNMRVTYRFAALNARGRPSTVNFPAKKSVPQHRIRWHAEKLAAKQGKKLLQDPPESFISPHLSFMGRDTYTKQWKRCGTHGGSLVENYDQASSRDLLAEAMLRVDEIDEFDLLLSIHDEVIAEAEIGTCAVQDFEAIMSVVPTWCPGMPIAAEGWVGPRLRK